MPKIEKLTVEKSVTVQKDDKTWIKNRFGLEVDVTDLSDRTNSKNLPKLQGRKPSRPNFLCEVSNQIHR